MRMLTVNRHKLKVAKIGTTSFFPKYKKGGYVVQKAVQNLTYGRLFDAPYYLIVSLTRLFLLQVMLKR